MWPKFGISMREFYHNLNFIRIWLEKNTFLKFKFNDLGLALGMALNSYTSVTKGLKLKARMFLGLISTLVEVTRETLVGDLFDLLPILKRVKKVVTSYNSNFFLPFSTIDMSINLFYLMCNLLHNFHVFIIFFFFSYPLSFFLVNLLFTV